MGRGHARCLARPASSWCRTWGSSCSGTDRRSRVARGGRSSGTHSRRRGPPPGAPRPFRHHPDPCLRHPRPNVFRIPWCPPLPPGVVGVARGAAHPSRSANKHNCIYRRYTSRIALERPRVNWRSAEGVEKACAPAVGEHGRGVLSSVRPSSGILALQRWGRPLGATGRGRLGGPCVPGPLDPVQRRV